MQQSGPEMPAPEGAHLERLVQSNRNFAHKVMLGAFAFVAINAALSEFKLRRLRKREGGFLISPLWAGRFVALFVPFVAVFEHMMRIVFSGCA